MKSSVTRLLRPRHGGDVANLIGAVAFTVVAVANAVAGEWGAMFLFLGVAFANAVFVLVGNAAYRTGWLAGRSAMLQSMVEASQRRMTFSQWLLAEAERDDVIPMISFKQQRPQAQDE